MALNINTNITNNLDGYLLDAKNVKGGFVVVANFSELANLPSACVVNGTLAYVSEIAGGMKGFYQYDGSSWIAINITGSNIYEFIAQSGLDYSETYNFTLSSAQFTSLLDDWNNFINGKKTTPPSFKFTFPTSDPETFSSFVIMLNSAIGNAETYVLNQGALLFLDNKTYTTNLTISLISLTMSLSFSELQAGGSGGGGTGTLTVKNGLIVKILDVDSAVLTKAYLPSDAVAKIKQLSGVSFDSAEEIQNAYDNTTLNNQRDIVALCFGNAISILHQYAPNQFRECIYDGIVYSDDDYGVQLLTKGDLQLGNNYYLGRITEIFTGVSNSIAFEDWNVEVEGSISGGSSEGSGSGKLYEWYFALERYDEDGDVVQYGYNSSPTDDNLYLHVLVYESNWERFKVNAQSMGITLNQPSDLTSLINTTFNENAGTTASNIYGLLGHLIIQSDKTLLTIGTVETEVFFDAMGLMATFLNNQIIPLMTDAGGTDIYYGLNVNNSCTLTEYGTSGGSGGEVATKKWYEYKLTEGSSSQITHSYISAKISEEQQNELFAQLSTALSQTISTPQDLIDIYNQLKADDLSNEQTIYQQLVQVWMMLWIYSAQEFRTIYTSAGFGKIPVNLLEISSIFQDTASGNPDGDKITFDANSILSITETTETVSGGSSSSQPSIPERFSLAYNLVVNINQEQFANGSWTGTNSDNIRTFQYNGSNADETKAKELVEFLTGVNVLDSYNATKPTPCFVFCTQSNICWKLQWDSSLLHAYKVENFPFVVKKKYYNFVLQDYDLNDEMIYLQLNIPYETMQEVYTQINQALGSNISTPQEVISVYDMLKADNISAQGFGMLCQLFVGLANASLFNNLCNILLGGGDAITARINATMMNNIFVGSTPVFNQSLATGNISFTSNSTLLIHERDEDELD